MFPVTTKTEDLKNIGEILCLPCNKLTDHPMHFSFYTQSHIEDLVCSIRKTGLLEPLTVCPEDDDNYRILSGHYRIRAVRRLKWKKVMCRVVKCDRRLSYVIYCASKLLTHGLSAMEEAYMISCLVTQEKFTLSEIGDIWGHSKSWVSRRLGLLTRLDPNIKRDLGTGYLSPRLAQELMRLPRGNNDQERVLKIIRKEHMNKDDTSRFVTWWLGAEETERRIVEEKGLHDADTKIEVDKVRVMSQTVFKHLQKCTNILNQLINFIEYRKIIDQWPADAYVSFINTSKHLDKVLTEHLALRKEV